MTTTAPVPTQTWLCRQVDGSHPGGFLTGLGLALLLDAEISFDHRHRLLVTVAGQDPEQAVQRAGQRLVDWTAPTHSPAWPVLEPATVKIGWAELAEPCRATWIDPDTARLIADLDVGSYETYNNRISLRAASSSLTLVSGQVRPRRTLMKLLEALDDPTEQLRRLLTGQPLTMVEASGMRLTARRPGMRVQSARQSWLAPVTELVAYLGAGCLQSQQKVTSSRGLVDGLAWVLNPVPLPLTAVVDLHEQQIRPAGWPAYTCQITSPPGKDSQKNFTTIREDA